MTTIANLMFVADTKQLDDAQKKITNLGSTSAKIDRTPLKLRADTTAIGTANQQFALLSRGAAAAQQQVSAFSQSFDALKGVPGPIAAIANRVGGLVTSLGGVAGVAGTAVGALTLAALAVEGIGAAMAAAADEADELAQKMGVSTTRLEELTVIANENGTSVEGLVRTYDKISKSMNKLDEDNEKTKYSLDSLGIAAEDLAGKTEAQIAGIVIKAWDDLGRSSKATAAVMQFIGPAFRDQIPALRAMADSTDDVSERVRKFGSVATPALTKAGALQEVALTNLGLGWKGLKNQIAELSSGMITAVSQWAANMLAKITSVMKEWREGNAAADALANSDSLQDRQRLMRQARGNLGPRASPVDVNAEFRRLRQLEANSRFRRSEIAGYGEVDAYLDEQKKLEALKKKSEAATMPDKKDKVGPLDWMKEPAYVAALAKAQMRSNEKNADYEAAEAAAHANKMARYAEEHEAVVMEQKDADDAKRRLAEKAEAYKAFIDPNYVIIQQLKEINALEAAGNLTAAEAAKARKLLQDQIVVEQTTFLDGWNGAFDQYTKNAMTAAQAGASAFSAAADLMTDAFTQFALTGEFSFKQFARSAIAAIVQIYAKMVATKLVGLIAGMFGGGAGTVSGGTGIGASTAGSFWGNNVKLALGGDVRPGQQAIVGEQGPEVLRMGTLGGHVYPAAANDSSGVQINGGIQIVVQGGNTNEETGAVLQAKLLETMKQVADGRINEATRPGGALRRA